MGNTYNVRQILREEFGEEKWAEMWAKRAEYHRRYRETEEGRQAIEAAQKKYAMSEKGRLARARANANYRAKQALKRQSDAEQRVASKILYRWCEMPEEKAKQYFDQLSATKSMRWRYVLDLIRARNQEAAEGKTTPLEHSFLREIV